ncbi:hypothetical protein DRH29_01680 [candidate division Kazan bacterium]|uniref:Uncharacterized protein n=1 Tax=candidate division Kazan bacterium TaxID=2202143 RepID=A0A420ZD40_UNCK3|nr:MAG: hypothetical protein DRH29_01680 [candidate division Kazan bacterium]
MEELSKSIKKIKLQKRNPHLHSELHALVDEVRVQFGETAKKGVGSFSFYLGFFKRLGVNKVRQILAEVKQSNAEDPKKLFWHLIGEESKK